MKSAEGAPADEWGMDEDLPISPPSARAPRSNPLHRIPINKARPAWIAIALAILIILAESVLLFRANSPEHDRTTVLSIVKRFDVILTTYNATTLNDQRTKVLAMTTGLFHDQYDRLTIPGGAFAAATSSSKASSQGSVVSLGIESLSGDKAKSLSVVDVTTSNKDRTTPQVTRQVLEIELVRTAHGWLVDSVTLL
jgi:hypothetical protein